jgi:dipeptidyl-peptidase III
MLYDLLILIFGDNGHISDLEGLKQRSGVSEEDWEDLLQYTSQVSDIQNLHGILEVVPLTARCAIPQTLSNLVNYKSFGFTKILPRIPADKFKDVVCVSRNSDKALELWEEVTVSITICSRNSE